MNGLGDSRWDGLEGGYRTAYDPRPALQALADDQGRSAAWAELWQELYHQGDVGAASYAAMTVLARLLGSEAADEWNGFSLAATIEEARLSGKNPPLPDWLAEPYTAAWDTLFQKALAALPEATDEALSNSLIAVVALGKGLPLLARLAMLDEQERRDLADEVGWI